VILLSGSVDFLEPGFAQRSLRGFRQENRSTLQPDDGSLREICLGWAYASESEPVDFVVFSLERVSVSIAATAESLQLSLRRRLELRSLFRRAS
jgi:hypothetical protein